ncbi:hypothetical protein D9M68_817900 [compost metagenome]
MVKFKEAGSEFWHVDLDRTLPRARLASQAAGHGGVDFMREILFILACVPPALGQRAQEVQRAAGGRFQHVNTGLPL